MASPYSAAVLKNRPKSYKTYVLEEGVASKRNLFDAAASAGAAIKSAEIKNTKRKEQMARLGLLYSGYGDYLKSEGKKRGEEQLQRAERDYLISEHKNDIGYKTYLNNYETLQQKEEDSFISQLTSLGIFDPEQALLLAAETALAPERQKSAAEYGAKLAKEAMIERAVKYAIGRNYNYRSALAYASRLGLDYESAREVALKTGSLSDAEVERLDGLESDEYYSFIKSELDKK